MVSLNIDNDLDDLPHKHNLRQDSLQIHSVQFDLLEWLFIKVLLGHDRKIMKNLNGRRIYGGCTPPLRFSFISDFVL